MWIWVALGVAVVALVVRAVIAWSRSATMEMPPPPDDLEWETESDPKWARRQKFMVAFIGPDRYVRMAKSAHPPAPMQPEDRCPWVTPLGAERCELRAGHRGSCVTTKKIRSAATGEVLDTVTSRWWGINYTVDD